MKRLEEIRDKGKVREYLKKLFESALKGSDSIPNSSIAAKVDKIMKSIDVIGIGSGEFVVSKGLFEITFRFIHQNNVDVIIRRITFKEKTRHYLKEIQNARKNMDAAEYGFHSPVLPPFLDDSLSTFFALVEMAFRKMNYIGLNSTMRLFLESRSENSNNTEYLEFSMVEA